MKKFFQELQSKRIYRVAGGYIVSAWVILQVAAIVFPSLGFPNSAMKVVLDVLPLGFVPALLLGWCLDLRRARAEKSSLLNKDATGGPRSLSEHTLPGEGKVGFDAEYQAMQTAPRAAELVFGWSFYRQATGGGTSSADEFFDAALAWFGDPDPRVGTAWEKGERLAKLVAHRRTLLILDGLEPLQNPPGPQEGRLREPSLQALLRELAAFNMGLCIITTWMPVLDIADHERTSASRCYVSVLWGPAAKSGCVASTWIPTTSLIISLAFVKTH